MAERINLEEFLVQKPQVSLALPSLTRMWLVSLCAFLAVTQSALSDSFSSLGVAAAALAGAVLTELFLLSRRGKVSQIRDGSAVASALILTLFLPNTIHPVYAAFGAVFAIAVVKHSFGGLGSNWLNPAAGGWLFIRCAWPASFNRALEASPLSLLADSLSGGAVSVGGSPFDIIKMNSTDFSAAASGIDASIRSFLNNTVLSISGAEIPGGYIDLFNMTRPGIIADRGMLALLAGTIIITASRVNRSWIPLAWLGVYVFLVRLAGALPYGGEWWRGDIIFALCSGGVIPAAFILSADPATGAKSNWGILAAAVFSGCLAWFFRYRGGEPYGAVFAAAAVNALLPLVRAFERKVLYEKRGSRTAAQGASFPGDDALRRSLS